MRNKRLLLQANLQNNINFALPFLQPNSEDSPFQKRIKGNIGEDSFGLFPKAGKQRKKAKGIKESKEEATRKAIITRRYNKAFPQQRRTTNARLQKLGEIDPRLADQYRKTLEAALETGDNSAVKEFDNQLEIITKKARVQFPNKQAKPLLELEQEVSDAKIARKAGKLAAQGEKIRKKIVGAEPETVREAKSLSKQIKALGQRFKDGASKLSISQFFQEELKRLGSLPPTLTRREFNQQAGRTLTLGTTALARLPQEVTELGNYVFNGVVGSNEIEAVFLGTKKAIIDTFQGGLTILAGGQLTPEAKADLENKLGKLGKTYSDLVDKLPDWAKEKYQDVDNYKLSRRSLLTGQWTKGKKVVTIDVDSKTLPDIWDEPLPPSSRLPKKRNLKSSSPLALPPARNLKPDELLGRRKPPITTVKGQLVKPEVSKTIKGAQDLVSKKPFFRKKGVIGLGIAAATGLTGYAAYNKLKNKETKKNNRTVNIEEPIPIKIRDTQHTKTRNTQPTKSKVTIPESVNSTNNTSNLTSTKLIAGSIALSGLALVNSGSQINSKQYNSLSISERKNYKKLKNGFYIRK